MSENSTTTDSLLDELEVFFGAASSALASVYAQLPGDARLPDGAALCGVVTGPACEFAHTLEAKVALRDLGPGATRLAEAQIPDPCFWTPEEPYLYKVDVVLRQGEETLASARRTLAIRRLGTAGRSFFLDAKRWVPRAVMLGDTSKFELGDCRAASLALIVDNPADDFCDAAAHGGVMLIARIGGSAKEITASAARLARHGSVAMLLVESENVTPEKLRRAARNVVLCELRSDTTSVPPSPWADAIVYDVEDLRVLATYAKERDLPVIAMRARVEIRDATAARAACDQLQRDLAAYADFAGYCV